MTGSRIPALIMSSKSRVRALKPKFTLLLSSTVLTAKSSSKPEFLASQRRGWDSESLTILIPASSSALSPFNSSSTLRALSRATPPPGTIPSSMAALVAPTASLTLSLSSFSSTSVAAPTLMTATPPESLAILSASFSLSNSEVDLSYSFLI